MQNSVNVIWSWDNIVSHGNVKHISIVCIRDLKLTLVNEVTFG